jgi:oxygen-independent coproporphyrinogen-3 oxidase
VVGNSDRSDLFQAYVGAVKRDVDVALGLLPALRARTRAVYFGGGTPSILPVRILGSLLEHVFLSVDLSCLSDDSTFELHPEDDSDPLLELLQAAGFPRVSVGVQSFHEQVLRSIGRPCTENAILRTLERIAERGFKTNVDIINGLHDDFAMWQQEVELVGALLERGTIRSATIYMLHPFPEANLRCDSSHEYWLTRNMCFAREYLVQRLGMKERPIYWFHKDTADEIDTFAPTFSIAGFGNSSYSCLGPWLLQNERSLKSYLAHKRGAGSPPRLPVTHCCRLTPAQMNTRALLFAIRSGSFTLGERDLDRIGAGFRTLLASLIQDGLLTCFDGRYTLTELGKIFAHQIPIMFFDGDVRQQFEQYLDSRFPAAGAKG